MKISALIIAAVSAQKNKPLTQQIAEEDRQRVDVRFRKVYSFPLLLCIEIKINNIVYNFMAYMIKVIFVNNMDLIQVVDLIAGWIDTEAAGWKKQSKLQDRLAWIEGRMEDYLANGCYEKAPDAAELEALDQVILKHISPHIKRHESDFSKAFDDFDLLHFI